MKVRKSVIALFLVPASLVYLAFILIPTVWAFYFSVFDWSGFAESMKFVGLGNFSQLFKDHLFWLSSKEYSDHTVAWRCDHFLVDFYLNRPDQFRGAWEKILPGNDLLAECDCYHRINHSLGIHI